MNADKRRSLGRCVLAGLVAGAVAALLANLASLVLVHQFNRNVDDLDWLLTSRMAVVTCVAGAFIYAGLVRWTKRPVAWFVAIGVAAVAVDSALVAMQPSGVGFMRFANPIHFVMAITALILIPTLAPALPYPVNGSAAK